MSQNIEKVEQELFQMYEDAINQLENDQITEGVTILKKLMNHPSIINQDDKKFIYGIYMSLAEILAQSENVTEKCEAINYYYQSTLIVENCWQTYRKMSILFRQLGMLPSALNLNLKASQYCSSYILTQPLLYQACCISFLMNNWDYFNKYFNMMKDNTNLKQSMIEIQNYHLTKQTTSFVNNLLEEQSQIEQKLQSLPQDQIYYVLQEQQFEQEIFLDIQNIKRFFKDIKCLLQINLNFRKNSSKDNYLISNTKIIITSNQNKQKKLYISKEQPNQVFKQIEKQKSKQSQYQQQFNLDQVIYNSNSKLIDLIKSNYGQDIISLSNINNNVKTQNEQNETQGCSISKFLSEKLINQSFHTVIELLKKLIILILKDYLSLKQSIKNFNFVSKELINCVVWAQYCTNQLVDDPFLKLQLLEIAYDELKSRFKEKKPKSSEEQNKIKNYIQFINNMKLELLQTDISSILTNKNQIKEYLQKYYIVMANIHSDIHFYQPKLAKYFINQLENPQLKQQINEKIIAYKIESELKTSKQVLQIITQWEEREQKLEDNEKIRKYIKQVIEYLKSNNNNNNNILKRLSIICLNQFYFTYHLDDLKDIQKFVQPLVSQILKFNNFDLDIGFIFLKFSFIYSLIEIDSSEILAKFTEIFLTQTKNINKYLILLEILKTNHIKFNDYFKFVNIDTILIEFIKIIINSKQKYKQLVEYLKNNIEADLELNYYLLHLLELKIQHTPQFIVQPNTLTIEIDKFESKLPQPDSFSDQSEDELEEPCYYSNQYKNIGLMQNQIESSFRITKKLCQFSNKTAEFLINHSVQINVGDPKIINHIKRFAKEYIKCEFGMSIKEISTQLYQILIQKYYLQAEFKNDLSKIELEFLGYYLPHCIKNTSDFQQSNEFLINKVNPALSKQIEQEIIIFVNELESYIFDNQDIAQSFSLQEHYNKIKNLNIESDYKANLFYLLQSAELINDEQCESSHFKNFLFALAYKDSSFLWNKFYLTLFDQARNYLSQKQKSEIDWFMCQQRVQLIIKNYQFDLNFLDEYFILMDLLQLQEQQNIYQTTLSLIQFNQIQQGYEKLSMKQQIIPTKVLDIKNNFRLLLLQEKIVMRKYYKTNIENIAQNLENLQILVSLIKQMNKHKIKYFFYSKEGDIEIEQDLLISIYKFIKRFLRHQLHNQLNQLIEVIKIKLPNLLNSSQNKFQFQFEQDKKHYKIQNIYDENQLEQEKNTIYSNQEVNLILNNILEGFMKNKQRLIRKKPQRYLIESFYYSTHLLYHSNTSIDQVFNSIQPVYQPNSKDLVYYYASFERYKCEKDVILNYYYFHDLQFLYKKSKILKLIIKILLKQQKYKEIVLLLDKLNKTYDLRLFQTIIGLLTAIKYIDEKILIRDIIIKVESLVKTNEFLKDEQILQLLNGMYIKLYEKEQQEQGLNDFEVEINDIKIEKGKKIIEDFKQIKKKPTKLKENQQISQQQQSQIQQSQISNQQQLYQLQSEQINDEIGQFKTQEGSLSPLIDLDIV